MKQGVFHGRMINGYVKLDLPSYYKNFCLSFPEEERITLTISKFIKKRTNPQNSYLWGVVYRTIADFVSERDGQKWTEEEVHEWAGRKFLGLERNNLGMVKTVSTASLDTEQFSDYVERICSFSAELGLYIPPPE